MTKIINIGAFLFGLLLLTLAILPVSAGTPFGTPVGNANTGLPTTLPIEIPQGIGTVGSDGNLHVNLVSEHETSALTGGQSFSPVQIAGAYQDKTMKKTTGVDGSLFEGGADIDYTVAPDNSVSGKVAYKFIEQGWTIKVKGTVSGQVNDNGGLTLSSNDASVKYAGQTYPISMTVNAQYNGNEFEGTKVISAAGVTGTLDFTGERVQ
ncbi:hypothetical protein ACKUB1_18460 [Methanospirillum stamsii]|nr:hypothetical protein [Methanospirillum stamsii]